MQILRSPAFLLSGLLALVSLPACSSTAKDEGVASMIRHGRYADALEAARLDASENPDDPRVQALYRDCQGA